MLLNFFILFSFTFAVMIPCYCYIIFLFWWIIIYSIMLGHFHFWQNYIIIVLLMWLLFELISIYPKSSHQQENNNISTYLTSLLWGHTASWKALVRQTSVASSYTSYELNGLGQVVSVPVMLYLQQSFQLVWKAYREAYIESLSWESQEDYASSLLHLLQCTTM